MNFKEEIDKKSMLSHIVLEFADNKNLKELISLPNYDITSMDIVVTINGIKVSTTTIEKMFNFMWKQLQEKISEPEEKRIKEAAKEMLQEKLNNLYYKVDDLINSIDYVIGD